MDERIRAAVGPGEGYLVGGAVRDELLGRPVLDVDVACRDPESAARAFRERAGGAVFLLSHRHGAWRVALPDGLTVDFTLLQGSLEEDLRGRDFTLNAIAVALAGGEHVDPLGGRADLAARRLRAVGPTVFVADPLRLLRAVRLEQDLGVTLDAASEELVRRHRGLVARPAGERILAELQRLTRPGWERLDDLGLLEGLGGRRQGLARARVGASPPVLLVAALGPAALQLPVSKETRRMARVLLGARPPADGSARAIHRFRRDSEPWALDALWFAGVPELEGAVRAAQAAAPAAPLLRGDELGVAPGPEVGRLLARVEEERAAGTIRTRDEALALVRAERR